MKPRIEAGFSYCQQKSFLFGKPYMPHDGEFALNHARCGIYMALKSLQLPSNSGVGMMVYNCHTVMNAIAQAGLKPVFIDVNDDLTIDAEDLRRKASGISVLIITHLFGIVNDVKSIMERFPELIVIEDCAHAFGINCIHGDFGVFSIGQGKLPSIGDGVLLVVKNAKYVERITYMYHNLSDYTWLQEMQLFYKLKIRSLVNCRWIYGWITLPLKQKRRAKSGKKAFETKRMSNGISAVYAKTIDRIPEIIDIRKKNAEKLQNELLKQDKCVQVFEGINAFMLVVRCQDPEKIRVRLRTKGIDSATHFSNSLIWANEFGYEEGCCPNVERMIGKLLMIPTY